MGLRLPAWLILPVLMILIAQGCRVGGTNTPEAMVQLLFADLERKQFGQTADLFRERDGRELAQDQREQVAGLLRDGFDGQLTIASAKIIRSEDISAAVLLPGSQLDAARAVTVELVGTGDTGCLRKGSQSARFSIDVVRTTAGEWYVMRSTAGGLLYCKRPVE